MTADWINGDSPAHMQGAGMYRESAAQADAHVRPYSTLASTSQLPIDSQADDERKSKTQYLLNKTLGPEHVASRQGGGGMKLSYLEGWRAINIANEVFGYNGWFTEIKYLEADFIDYNPESQRYCMGVTAIVRVRLQDGAAHEDVGYGKLENTKSKADGLDKCKKEAVTDALKRALRHFGKLLGNCLYDKAHLEGLKQMKAPKPKFDFAALYKPERDNVPLGDPSAPWNAAPSAAAGGSTNDMPPPPPKPLPQKTPGAPPPHPAHMTAHLQRAKTAPGPSGGGGGGSSTPAAKPVAPSAAAAGRAPPAPQRAATVAARPNPLDRSGAQTAAEFALNSEDETLLAGMDLDVDLASAAGGAGETSFSSEGDVSVATNGTGRVYFEGDSGFAEESEVSMIKNEPPRPPHRLSPTEAKLAAQARLAENQRKKEQQQHTQAQGHPPQVQGQPQRQQQHQHQQQGSLRRMPSVSASSTAVALDVPHPAGGSTTLSAAQLLKASSTSTAAASGAGAGPVPALGTARPGGLRPAQPPSRSNSLTGPSTTTAGGARVAGALPALNVGAGLARAATAGGAVPAAGGAQGVSGMVSASPPRAGSVGAGEGFVSARGVKRGVGDGYDPSPPAAHPHAPHRGPSSSGGGHGHSGGETNQRAPFGELAIDGTTGAVKRARS
ncbi:hypothetical protein JCM10207_008951 [Rhodosporidiobolus poonsookiae]